MAVTDWLDAPTLAKVPEGYDALHRIWVLGDSTAAPLTPINVTGVQNITTTPFAPQSTKQVYQQGSGEDEFYEKRRMSSTTLRFSCFPVTWRPLSLTLKA